MANTVIDIVADADITEITSSSGGTVTNDVSVVIADGVSKNEAHTALQSIVAALVGDTVTLD